MGTSNLEKGVLLDVCLVPQLLSISVTATSTFCDWLRVSGLRRPAPPRELGQPPG